jgi:hypothetical protein
VADYSRPLAFMCGTDATLDMCFLPATNILVAGGLDSTLYFWNLNNLPWAKQRKE